MVCTWIWKWGSSYELGISFLYVNAYIIMYSILGAFQPLFHTFLRFSLTLIFIFCSCYDNSMTSNISEKLRERGETMYHLVRLLHFYKNDIIVKQWQNTEVIDKEVDIGSMQCSESLRKYFVSQWTLTCSDLIKTQRKIFSWIR